MEEVKERNGPFAGKRVARPVANYEACHTAVVAHLQAALGNKFDQVPGTLFMLYTDVTNVISGYSRSEEEEDLYPRQAFHQVC